MMKRLLFVYDRMMVGGTTTALLALLHGIDYTQYSVDLLLFENDGQYREDIPAQVRVLPEAKKPSRLPVSIRKILRTALNGGLFRSLAAYRKYRGGPKGNLRNILMHFGMKAQIAISRKAEEHYDAAIGFIEGWAAQYVLSDKVRADRRIAWIHPDYEKSYLIPEADRKFFSRADAIVTVAENCKNNMQKTFPEYADRVFCVENIVSCELLRLRSEAFDPAMELADINLCTVCRCDMAVKGLDRMVNALEKLQGEGLLSGVRWHLVGDGADLEAVRHMVEEKQLTEAVTFYGMQKNPLPYLRKMDLFVLPSRYEGKPVSVQEALCLGVPCLVTAYASAKEQICHGQNGLIVENSDTGPYEGLRRLLTDRSLLKQLAAGAKTAVPGSNAQIDKFYELLRS